MLSGSGGLVQPKWLGEDAGRLLESQPPETPSSQHPQATLAPSPDRLAALALAQEAEEELRFAREAVEEAEQASTRCEASVQPDPSTEPRGSEAVSEQAASHLGLDQEGSSRSVGEGRPSSTTLLAAVAGERDEGHSEPHLAFEHRIEAMQASIIRHIDQHLEAFRTMQSRPPQQQIEGDGRASPKPSEVCPSESASKAALPYDAPQEAPPEVDHDAATETASEPTVATRQHAADGARAFSEELSEVGSTSGIAGQGSVDVRRLEERVRQLEGIVQRLLAKESGGATSEPVTKEAQASAPAVSSIGAAFAQKVPLPQEPVSVDFKPLSPSMGRCATMPTLSHQGASSAPSGGPPREQPAGHGSAVPPLGGTASTLSSMGTAWSPSPARGRGPCGSNGSSSGRAAAPMASGRLVPGAPQVLSAVAGPRASLQGLATAVVGSPPLGHAGPAAHGRRFASAAMQPGPPMGRSASKEALRHASPSPSRARAAVPQTPGSLGLSAGAAAHGTNPLLRSPATRSDGEAINATTMAIDGTRRSGSAAVPPGTSAPLAQAPTMAIAGSGSAAVPPGTSAPLAQPPSISRGMPVAGPSLPAPPGKFQMLPVASAKGAAAWSPHPQVGWQEVAPRSKLGGA